MCPPCVSPRTQGGTHNIQGAGAVHANTKQTHPALKIIPYTAHAPSTNSKPMGSARLTLPAHRKDLMPCAKEHRLPERIGAPPAQNNAPACTPQTRPLRPLNLAFKGPWVDGLSGYPWVILTTDGDLPSLQEIPSPIPHSRFPIPGETPKVFHNYWRKQPPYSMQAVPNVAAGYLHPGDIPEEIPRPDILTPVPLRIPANTYVAKHILVFTQRGQPGVCIAEWGKDASKVESELATNELLIVNPDIEYSWPGYIFCPQGCMYAQGTLTSTQVVSIIAESLNRWVAALMNKRAEFRVCTSDHWKVGPEGFKLLDIYLMGLIELELDGGRVVWMPALCVREKQKPGK
ncbi:hypothetical protein BD311DRAFT_780741 [Dichomitus squalens]|uniref:Uncharacterized protein n=1 Tax=Dichomitus squalens TaxID=114155 RepID=A0A4Q9MDW7_9APHY|nr:hypothetical protein BD311DRAFT_780741 [Dichomitus squalens]